MATLSKKLSLTGGVWQEVGSVAFIGDKGTGGTVEIVNADALPVGDVPEASEWTQTIELYRPAPLSGSWYVRYQSGATGAIKYTEVA